MNEQQSRLKKKYQSEIVRKMKASGVYRREHQFMIGMLADMFADYDTLIAACEQEDSNLAFGTPANEYDREDAADVFLATLNDMKWPEG